ncbi:MAG: hypothetical protein LAO79_27000 [Acidobacteriia bacterium]|nr:hypothetical protein [Terriglobia bacterium]
MSLPTGFIAGFATVPAGLGFLSAFFTKRVPWIAALAGGGGVMLLSAHAGFVEVGLRLGIIAAGLIFAGGLLGWPFQFRPPYRD